MRTPFRTCMQTSILLFLLLLTPSQAIAQDDFKSLFDEHGSIMLLIEVETGSIRYANQAAADFYGYSIEELQSMAIQQINTLSPDEIAQERKAAAQEERNYFIFPHRLSSGEIRTVEVYSWPYVLDEETVLFSIIQDITERILAEEALTYRTRLFRYSAFIIIAILLGVIIQLIKSYRKRKKSEEATRSSEEKYRTIFETSPLGIFHFDKNGILTACNNKLTEIIGASRNTLVGSDMLRLPDQDFASCIIGTLKGNPVIYEGTHHSNTASKTTPIRVFFATALGKEGEPQGGIGMVEDCTQRKLAEDQLKKSETEKSLILSAITERVAYLDKELRIIWANQRAADSVNKSIEELMGTPCYESRYQRTEPCDDCPINKALKTGKPHEDKITTPDGLIWHLRGFPVRNDTQEVTGVVMVGRDITDQVKAEQEIRESEARFKDLVELAPDAIFVQIEGKFSYLNHVAVTLFGAQNREQLLDMPVMSRIHPDYREIISKRIYQLTHEKQPAPFMEQIYLKLDGTPVPVEVGAIPILYIEKNGALVYVRDITERKVVERKEKENQELLVKKERMLRRQKETLLSLTSQGIWAQEHLKNALKGIIEACADLIQIERVSFWIYDKKHEYIKCKDLYLRSSKVHVKGDRVDVTKFGGYVDSHAKGEIVSVEDVRSDPRTQHAARDYHRKHNIISVLDTPVWLKGRVGGVLSFESVGEKRIWSEEDQRLAIAMAALISLSFEAAERRHTQKKLLKLNQELENRVQQRTAQLEASNKEHEAFTYSVSHDLRAPLRTISGFMQIIQEDYNDRFDEEGHRLLKTVQRNAMRMDELITDLLNLSQTNRTQMQYHPINMENMVQSVYEEVSQSEAQKPFEFKVEPLPDAWGDPSLIQQVWKNLISNAIKYTMPKEKREINISGHRKDGMNIYIIKDTGVGFDPKFTDRIFGVFQRLHSSQEFEGTGIGLAIVERIINRHGGKVWAMGEINEGASFYFSLPDK